MKRIHQWEAIVAIGGGEIRTRSTADIDREIIRLSNKEHPKILFIPRGPAAHSFPSVGAFDLCPGRDESQLPVLKDFLSSVLESVAEGSSYQEEEGLFL